MVTRIECPDCGRQITVEIGKRDPSTGHPGSLDVSPDPCPCGASLSADYIESVLMERDEAARDDADNARCDRWRDR